MPGLWLLQGVHRAGDARHPLVDPPRDRPHPVKLEDLRPEDALLPEGHLVAAVRYRGGILGRYALVIVLNGAGGGSRTRMGIHPEDFKSFVYTIYDI